MRSIIKLAVSSWSLHREIPSKVSLVNFPELCVKEFGVNAVELCQMHFLSIDQDYIEVVKDALDRSRAKVVNIPVDIGYAADLEKRRDQFKIITRWFHIAKYLNSPSIRVNASKSGDEEALQRAIKGYKELIKTAERTGVNLLIENHGGISENPDNILKIVEEVGSEYFRVCADFGNFQPEIRYEGLEKLAKYTAIVHVKTYEFSEDGEETTIDIKRCVRIFVQRGFEGFFSVEFEGKGDPHVGVKKTISLLRKV